MCGLAGEVRFDGAPAERMLRQPDLTGTTLGSTALWQLAVLEMRLQEMENRAR